MDKIYFYLITCCYIEFKFCDTVGNVRNKAQGPMLNEMESPRLSTSYTSVHTSFGTCWKMVSSAKRIHHMLMIDTPLRSLDTRAIDTGTTEKKLHVHVHVCVCVCLLTIIIHENDDHTSAVKAITKEHHIRYQLIWRV